MLGPWIKANWKWFKQEVARVNIDILGISELKWTGMGEFNSDDHYLHYCGQESLRRNGAAIIVNKRVQNAVLGCNVKNDRIISVCFQGKPFSITVIQVYAPTSNAEEAEVERFYEYLQDLLELTPPKRCPFHYRGLECKSMKSRNTWSNRQIWPWSIEWSRTKANRVLPREFTGHSKHSLPTTQEDTWISPDGQHRNQIDYILYSQRWRSSIQSAKTRPRADCGSDYELLIAEFRLKLKKVGKTTRPLRYDLIQIPYDYTVEVRNILMVLDLIECLKNYGWRFMTLYRRHGSRLSPRKRNAKRQNGCLRSPYK